MNTINLLERYLQAIGRYLPPTTKDDTLAELRANLLAEMDERAEDLGRPLTDAETAGILRAHGKPEQVALRYLPQRSLIGPTHLPLLPSRPSSRVPTVFAGLCNCECGKADLCPQRNLPHQGNR